MARSFDESNDERIPDNPAAVLHEIRRATAAGPVWITGYDAMKFVDDPPVRCSW